MLAQIKVMDWRAMDSAPKDGTAILGFFPGKEGYIARQDVQIIHWSGWGGGVWETQGGGKPLDYEVAAWMPLPEAPAKPFKLERG